MAASYFFCWWWCGLGFREKKTNECIETIERKKILKQKTESGVLIKKKRMGKVVYIEKNRISNPHRTRFIFILFLRKSCMRKQSELQRNLCVLWTVDGAVLGQ